MNLSWRYFDTPNLEKSNIFLAIWLWVSFLPQFSKDYQYVLTKNLHVGIPNFENDVRLVIKIEKKGLNLARSLQIWSFKRTTWRKFWIKGHWLKLGKKGKIPLFTHLLISFFWPEDQVYSALIYAFKMFIGFHSSFYLHQQANLMSKEYLYANIP